MTVSHRKRCRIFSTAAQRKRIAVYARQMHVLTDQEDAFARFMIWIHDHCRRTNLMHILEAHCRFRVACPVQEIFQGLTLPGQGQGTRALLSPGPCANGTREQGAESRGLDLGHAAATRRGHGDWGRDPGHGMGREPRQRQRAAQPGTAVAGRPTACGRHTRAQSNSSGHIALRPGAVTARRGRGQTTFLQSGRAPGLAHHAGAKWTDASSGPRATFSLALGTDRGVPVGTPAARGPDDAQGPSLYSRPAGPTAGPAGTSRRVQVSARSIASVANCSMIG